MGALLQASVVLSLWSPPGCPSVLQNQPEPELVATRSVPLPDSLVPKAPGVGEALAAPPQSTFI